MRGIPSPLLRVTEKRPPAAWTTRSCAIWRTSWHTCASFLRRKRLCAPPLRNRGNGAQSWPKSWPRPERWPRWRISTGPTAPNGKRAPARQRRAGWSHWPRAFCSRPRRTTLRSLRRGIPAKRCPTRRLRWQARATSLQRQSVTMQTRAPRCAGCIWPGACWFQKRPKTALKAYMTNTTISKSL